MSDSLMFAIIFSGIWTLVGVIFLIIGIVMLKNRKKKEIKCTSMTYGKITDIVKHNDPSTDDVYSPGWYPVFEYNIGEQKFIREYHYGSHQTRYTIGQDVEVYYNPEDYNEYYIGGDTLPKKFAIVLTLVGIVAIFIAIISAILIL